MPYLYNSHEVLIPKHAEVSSAFRPYDDAAFSQNVQAALDGVKPWEPGQDPIKGFDLPRSIAAQAVPLFDDEAPRWGINPHHKARHPGLSPFIELAPSDSRIRVGRATLELSGTVKEPILTRVYAGDYMPPLPWMTSAARAVGGRDACLAFWKNHAFLIIPQRQPVELTDKTPDWF